MVLAAGLGSRLRPLTDNLPKALVEVGGRTLLEIALERLRRIGVREAIVNVHHLADMVVDFLDRKGGFGMRIEISREKTLLDTGGGLRKAAWFFLEDADRLDEPFILHNVDVISTIDIVGMVRFHKDRAALATLAVQDRPTSRYLVFDDSARLCGRRNQSDEAARLVRPAEGSRELAFSGIHVISPRLLSRLPDRGAFSIIDAYLELAGGGAEIVGFRADEYDWLDAGRPESLERARERLGRDRAPRR